MHFAILGLNLKLKPTYSSSSHFCPFSSSLEACKQKNSNSQTQFMRQINSNQLQNEHMSEMT